MRDDGRMAPVLMRSQKQRNRSPRLFKRDQSAGNWAGNRGGQDAYLPQPKPIYLAPKKINASKVEDAEEQRGAAEG